MIGRLICLWLVVTGTCVAAEWEAQVPKILGTLPGKAVAWERSVSKGDRTIRFSGVTFSTRDYEFRVLDNPPESRRSFAALLEEAGAVAGINGGYFHKDDRPLGLVVAGGKTLHSYERAKLLSGILAVRDRGASLIRVADYNQKTALREALQAGPWLVEEGRPVSGLHSGRRARRTVVASGGGNRWVLLASSPATLAELGEALTAPGLPGDWTIQAALNLDGGSSTALLALSGERKLLDIPSFGAVRNYLAIVPRER